MNDVEQRIDALRAGVDQARTSRARAEAQEEALAASVRRAREEMTTQFGVGTAAGANVMLAEMDAQLESLTSKAEQALGRTI